MIETPLFCTLNGHYGDQEGDFTGHSASNYWAAREQRRLVELGNSGLLEAENIPVFEEATQVAAQFLHLPMGWIGLMERDNLWLKTTLGLSKLGLRNELVTSRRLPRPETFCVHVVDSHQVLAIDDTTQHPAFASSILVQHYGLRAYLGAPLLLANGYCLGTLALFDRTPHAFTEQEAQILQMLARWCISEVERDRLWLTVSAPAPASRDSHQALVTPAPAAPVLVPESASSPTRSAFQESLTPPQETAILSLRLQLVGQLMEHITSPLTAILGMAGMLDRGIYGPLTEKQQEYLTVILNSGQTLRSITQEVLELADLDEVTQELHLMPVDVEMLCQQVVQGLSAMAEEHGLDLQFSVEPGQRLWQLDRNKVRQMLSHLIHGIVQSAKTDGVLRLHVSRKRDALRFTLWLSNPWLDEGLLPMDSIQTALINEARSEAEVGWFSNPTLGQTVGQTLGQEVKPGLAKRDGQRNPDFPRDWSGNGSPNLGLLPDREVEVTELRPGSLGNRPEHLRFLLSQYLAELHGGTLAIQNSLESGCRYILSLPL